jgi:hypothetical protein
MEPHLVFADRPNAFAPQGGPVGSPVRVEFRPYEKPPPARVCLAGRRWELEEVDLPDLLAMWTRLKSSRGRRGLWATARGALLPYAPNLLERLSGNSGQAPFHGPVSLHNGRKGTLLGASRYRQTRDPTRPATFQTVSEYAFSEVRLASPIALDASGVQTAGWGSSQPPRMRSDLPGAKIARMRCTPPIPRRG